MKLIQLFESEFPTSREEVESILKTYYIHKYTINDDLTVNVNEDVNLHYEDLEYFPVKFGVVQGNFDCSMNRLKSLKGAPRIVHGHFDCVINKLATLEGAPREVDGDFDCSNNSLISLKGAPKEISGDFICRKNKDLKSLDGIGNVARNIFSDIE